VDSIQLGSQIALNQLQTAATPDPTEKTPGDVMNSFGDLLQNSLGQVNQLQVDAEKTAQAYAVGEAVPLHQVMISAEKADISLQMATEIRNKIVQAYQTISQMSV
jgi:flagellar hook-basal body complex protein FliE